jgi:hypothetical protein
MLWESFGRLSETHNSSSIVDRFYSTAKSGQHLCGRQPRGRGRSASADRLVQALVVLSSMLMGVSGGALAAGRVALVMVAEDYQKLEKSTVGVKRGGEIADALTARGFDVLLSTNPSNAVARTNLRDFSAKAAGADLAIAIMIGHGSTWNGHSFFLPSNSEIQRASDLLSRGLSLGNIAQIAGRAKIGGVFFLMTRPSVAPMLAQLDAGQESAPIAQNVFVVFSSAPALSVSQANSAGENAAESLMKALQQPAPSLNDAVRAVVNGDTGVIIGTVADVTLAAVSHSSQDAPANVSSNDQNKKSEFDAKLDAERMARETAEKQVRELQAKGDQAQLEISKAQAEARRAQVLADKTIVDTRRAQTEADAKLEAERAARRNAEKQSADQQAKAEQAEAVALKAQADATRVQTETDGRLQGERTARASAERQARELQGKVEQAQAAVLKVQADATRVQTETEGRLQAERTARASAERQSRELQAKVEQLQAAVGKSETDKEIAQTEVAKSQTDTQKALAEAVGKLDVERVARETAEKRARELQARSDQSEAELQKAQADSRRAQADLLKAQADARRLEAEAERAKSEEARPRVPMASTPGPFLSADEPQIAAGDYYVTNLDPNGDNWLALKAAPNRHSVRLMKMPPGTPLKVLRREGSWFNVRLQDGSEGWAEAQYIGCCRAHE